MSKNRNGFTLTELLVVIAIIAMLVGLVSVGVMRAMSTAKATRIKVELDQIDSAVKAYKDKYGSYPVCDLRNPPSAALKQHFAMAFPRYNIANLQNDLQAAGVDQTNFRPDQAIYFYLRGFSSDPLNPFVSLKGEPIRNGSAVTGQTTKLTPLFEFDQTRLGAVDSTGTDQPITVAMPSYFPTGTTPGTTGAPYIYWDSRSYGEVPPPSTADATRPQRFFNAGNSTAKGDLILYPAAGILVPYWLDTNGNKLVDTATETWVNPDSYQLISAGGDKMYGTKTSPAVTDQGRLYPSAVRYDNSSALADDDNATNFTAKARIGDDRP